MLQILAVAAVIAGVWRLMPRPAARLPEGVTEITLWMPGAVGSSFEDVLDEFERRNPEYRVVTGHAAVRDAVGDPQRFLCGVAGGVPPDVIYFDRFAVVEWASRGAFRALDDLIERDRDLPDGIRPEDYYVPTWEEPQYEGRQYAIPNSCDDRALFYNKDLLVRAGYVDADGEAVPPRTWEELREYAVRLTRRDENGRLAVLGFAPNYGNSWLYIYGWMNGGRFMSGDGLRCTLNDERIVGALDWITGVYDDLGGAQEVYAFQSSFQGGELDPFLTGKVAMKIDGDWVLMVIANFKKDLNFGVAPGPMPLAELEAGRDPVTWLGGWSYAIPSSALNPEAAWKLIRWLSSDEANLMQADVDAQIMRSQGRLFIPRLHPRKSVTDEVFRRYLFEDPTVPDRYKEAAQVFIDLLPDSYYRPVTPVGQLLWNEHVRALEKAIFHEMTPRAALDTGTAVVQKQLDQVLHPPAGPRVRWGVVVVAYLAALAALCAGVYAAHKRRHAAHGYFRQEWWAGVLFASPWIVGFVVFTGGPIVFSILMSFCRYDIINPARLIGLGNYREMFTDDPVFWKSLGNTAFMVMGLPLSLALGLGLAMLLDTRVRGLSGYRTVYYLPAIVPAVASAILWIWVFHPTDGLLNAALRELPSVLRVDNPPSWLQDKNWAKPALIIHGLWGAGAGMIIWLAGLKSIPTQLHEAAAIDGAGGGRRFLHVTLPMLSPYIFFNLVMGMIGVFQIFTQAYVMTAGGPVDSTLFYAYNLFNQAFRYLRMGYASAMAWFLFAIIMVLTVVQLKLAPRWVHYEAE